MNALSCIPKRVSCTLYILIDNRLTLCTFINVENKEAEEAEMEEEEEVKPVKKNPKKEVEEEEAEDKREHVNIIFIGHVGEGFNMIYDFIKKILKSLFSLTKNFTF